MFTILRRKRLNEIHERNRKLDNSNAQLRMEIEDLKVQVAEALRDVRSLRAEVLGR